MSDGVSNTTADGLKKQSEQGEIDTAANEKFNEEIRGQQARNKYEEFTTGAQTAILTKAAQTGSQLA